MKLADGRRPWPIRLFAAAFVAQALISFWGDITHRGALADMLLERGGLLVSDDGAIVVSSVRLTVALIPVALVWFFASPFARWMVLVMALGKLALNSPETIAVVLAGIWPKPTFLVSHGLALLGAAFLFTPGARSWFVRDKPDVSVFA